MARYRGPVCRLCRREGEKLFLKGEKCSKNCCPVNNRTNVPGQHGQGKGAVSRNKLSNYGLQLREKQKVKRIYGVLEGQFRDYFEEAYRLPGVTGEVLLRLLELRLDNVMYRMGFGRSRTEARQIVRHNWVTVNGKKVNIPSYQTKAGDIIAIREKNRDNQRVKDVLEVSSSRIIPEWITVEPEQRRGTVASLPTRDQIKLEIKESMIVEHYSNK